MSGKGNRPGGMLQIVVLVSGSGSNLQAIMDASARGDLSAQVLTVISDQPEAYALQRAARAGLSHECIAGADYRDREAYDIALARRLSELSPDLVVLAGFMRILGADLVNSWCGRMLNIHPSLLPAYRGLHTHRRVLEAGEPFHGTTVHYVTAELDGGPIIAQSRLRVGVGDDEESLVKRILTMEHRMYPQVIGWIAQGRLRLSNGEVEFDGVKQTGPLRSEEKNQAVAVDV
jgi:phosphoribosylglycinamide formyltransferase-1